MNTSHLILIYILKTGRAGLKSVFFCTFCAAVWTWQNVEEDQVFVYKLFLFQLIIGDHMI